MSSATLYEIKNNIAVISLNSPPVNGLGQAVRESILENFKKAHNDDNVKAIVIASTGKLFCGGADISEFGTDKMTAAPFLGEVLNQIEDSQKPVVAAINGTALGGGLELCLVCDYRFASAKAKLGLPEVHLGILPGAGGTQRLPRLAGAVKATEMIVSGKPVSAEDAHQSGFVDAVHSDDSDFLDAALAYTTDLIASNAPVKTCADLTVDTTNIPENFFADFRKSIARKTRGYLAPENCIQCVEASLELDLAAGLKKEAELFMQCMKTSQARAQQHLFFAERAATKIPGIDKKTPLRKIEQVAIIGAGTMGGGIAMNFVNAGVPVKVLELKQEALDKGFGVIRNNYEISAKKGRITEEQVEQRMSLLTGTLSYAELNEADLIIEAVFENMDIKKKVFASLDQVAKPGAILASNTSTLDVDEIASATKRPQDVIGLHFFSPANVMKLLEIVRGSKTADDVLMTSIKMAQLIRKVPVVSENQWGFIGNRILEPYGREAGRLMLEGASPAQIDKVLYDFGFAMGLPSVMDLAGIDVGYLTRQARKDELAKDPSYAAVSDRLYELGRYGQKTGRGAYIYKGREKIEDPEVMQISKELAEKFDITQREISEQEILERTVYMLINEGAHVLGEGVTYRSSDIDVVYAYGYGFPGHRGGPMQYADEIGLDKVLAGIEKYREELGDYGKLWFTPAPVLKELAAAGKTFKSYKPSAFKKT